MIRATILAVALSFSLLGQSAPPKEKVCHKFDWNAGYDIPVPCKPAKEHPKLAKIKHAFILTGETVGVVVVAGGVLYAAALSPSGIQVH